VDQSAIYGTGGSIDAGSFGSIVGALEKIESDERMHRELLLVKQVLGGDGDMSSWRS
jgi:hypothetical protein